MSEPNETHFESEESEALSVANELAGDDWQVEEGGAEDSPVGPGPRESSPAPAASPAPQAPSLTLDQARQAWNQATATRAQLREHANQQYMAAQAAQAEQRRYEEMANAILRASQAQEQVQQQEPQIDPELQRYLDTRQQELIQQMQGMLGPVLNQAQQVQQHQEVQQQVAAEQAQWGEFREIVSRSEQDYMATPEGQGYNDRVGGYEQAMLTALHRTGLDEAPARKLVNEQLKGFTMLGMALNVPPPVLLDNYINSVIEFALSYKNGNGQPRNGNGQYQQQPQRQQPQGRMSPQVQIARMATQNGAVGSPPSSGATGHGNGVVDVGDLMSRNLTGKDIDALVKQYGSLDKAIRYLDRVGAELEQVEG